MDPFLRTSSVHRPLESGTYEHVISQHKDIIRQNVEFFQLQAHVVAQAVSRRLLTAEASLCGTCGVALGEIRLRVLPVPLTGWCSHSSIR